MPKEICSGYWINMVKWNNGLNVVVVIVSTTNLKNHNEFNQERFVYFVNSLYFSGAWFAPTLATFF
jgi:hypothetical protein